MIEKLLKLSFLLLFFLISFHPQKLYAEDVNFYSTLVPNDTFYNKQWYLDRINAPQAWDKQNTKNDIIIAILDSGVQTDHPDLVSNIWINKSEIPNNNIDDDNNSYVDDVNGWDFINNNNDPNPKLEAGFIADEAAHGTIVAGIAAAIGNNKEGVSGVTWNSKIMPLLVLDSSGSGEMRAVINAIDYAIKNKADIINLSFAGAVYSAEFEAAIRRAYRAGILIVAAAGNNVHGEKGPNLDYLPMYPVCNDGYYNENMVLGVAATDALDQKPYFSAYGKKCVDISAPGVSIFSSSLFAPSTINGENVLNKLYDGYWSGTSMAAPQVSGAAALILGVNPSLSRQELFNILLGSADYIEKLNPDNFGQLGSGRLNVSRAIDMARELIDLKKIGIANAPSSYSATSSKIIISDPNGNFLGDLSFAGNYKGGVNLAGGDLDGDGIDEIVLGAGLNGGPQVQIFKQNGKIINQFFAYNKYFRGGVKVAIGDINGDGVNDIVTAAGPGGGPHIKCFNVKGELLGQFFAFDKNFRGGVNIAVGDVNGDGIEDIVSAAGPGGGPQIRFFNKSGKVLGQFFAFDKNFRGGVNVTTADIDGGLRKNQEIIASPASRGSSHIRIFNNDGQLINQFFAFGEKYFGQTNLSAGDVNRDGLDEIISSAGPGASPHVRIFKADGTLIHSYFAFANDSKSGVNNTSIIFK